MNRPLGPSGAAAGDAAWIERSFGNAGSFGGARGPPPAWVRGPDRLRTWVGAKLLSNAVRSLKHKDLRHP